MLTVEIETRSHEEKPKVVWYFAYGSNMSSAKFIGRRGIVPIKTAKASLPNWVLVAEIPGVPYSEPSYFSVRQRRESQAEDASIPDVIGTAYLITTEQYKEVIASEGGQIAYEDIEVHGKLLGSEGNEDSCVPMVFRTLGSTIMTRHPCPTPSQRYMQLVIEGAQEARLPASYLDFLSHSPHYVPPTTNWKRIGAAIFLTFCNPIWKFLDIITHRNTQPNGNVPWYIVQIVRGVILFIWMIHDLIFAPIFGRGDGLEHDKKSSLEGNDPMLPLLGNEKPYTLYLSESS